MGVIFLKHIHSTVQACVMSAGMRWLRLSHVRAGFERNTVVLGDLVRAVSVFFEHVSLANANLCGAKRTEGEKSNVELNWA